MAHRMFQRDSIRYRNSLTLDSRNGFNSQVNMVMRTLATQTTNNEYLHNLKHSVIQYRFAGSPNLKSDSQNSLETLVTKSYDISSTAMVSTEFVSSSSVPIYCNGNCRRYKSYRTRSNSTLSSLSSNSESRCDSFCSEYRENSDSDKDVSDLQRCKRNPPYEHHSLTPNSLVSGCSDYHSYSSSGEILSDYTEIKQSLSVSQTELAKKCSQHTDSVTVAKDRQVVEANKNATILFEQLDKEKEKERAKQQATQRKRERRKQKKRVKPEKQPHYYDNDDDEEDDDDDHDNEHDDGKKYSEDNNIDIDLVIKNYNSGFLTLRTEDQSVDQVSPSLSNIDEIVDKNGISFDIENGKNVVSDFMEDEIYFSTPDAASHSFILEDSFSLPNYCFANDSQNGTSITSRKKKKKSVSKVIATDYQQLKACSNSDLISISSPVSSSRCNSMESTRRASVKKRHELSTHLVDDLIQKPTIISLESAENRSTITSTQQAFSLTATNNVNAADGRAKNLSSPRKGRSDRRGTCTTDRIINNTGTIVCDDEWKVVVPKRVSVPIPKKDIGKVIGQAGSTINSIRLLSGAHIDIDNKETDIGERTVHIRGSADSVNKAKRMIENVMNGKPKRDILVPAVKGSSHISLTSTKSTSTLSNSSRCRRNANATSANANIIPSTSVISTHSVLSKPLPICRTTHSSTRVTSRMETPVSQALTLPTGEIMNFASVAAAGVVSSASVSSVASYVPATTIHAYSNRVFSRAPGSERHRTPDRENVNTNQLQEVCKENTLSFCQNVYSDEHSPFISNMGSLVSTCNSTTDCFANTLLAVMSSSSRQDCATLPTDLSVSNIDHSVLLDSFSYHSEPPLFALSSSLKSHQSIPLIQQPISLSLSHIDEEQKRQCIENYDYDIHYQNISLQQENPKERSLNSEAETSFYGSSLDFSTIHMSRGNMMTLPRAAPSLNPGANSFEPRPKPLDEISRTSLNMSDSEFLHGVSQFTGANSVHSSPFIMQYAGTSDTTPYFNGTSTSTNLQIVDSLLALADNVATATTAVQQQNVFASVHPTAAPPRPIGAERRKEIGSDCILSSALHPPQRTVWQIGNIDTNHVDENLSSWNYHIAASAAFQLPKVSCQESLVTVQQQLAQDMPFDLGLNFEFEQ